MRTVPQICEHRRQRTALLVERGFKLLDPALCQISAGALIISSFLNSISPLTFGVGAPIRDIELFGQRLDRFSDNVPDDQEAVFNRIAARPPGLPSASTARTGRRLLIRGDKHPDSAVLNAGIVIPGTWPYVVVQ